MKQLSHSIVQVRCHWAIHLEEGLRRDAEAQVAQCLLQVGLAMQQLKGCLVMRAPAVAEVSAAVDA